jgi:hypothetical protein
MEYMFVFGPVAVTVTRCEVRFERECEAGARVELRRAEVVPGNREGNEGLRVLPVAEGGIWRADLLTVVDPPTNEPRYHYHPEYDSGDVGERVFDPQLTADPPGWAMRRLGDFRSLLVESGAADVADLVDYAEVARALPAMRAAIDACL